MWYVVNQYVIFNGNTMCVSAIGTSLQHIQIPETSISVKVSVLCIQLYSPCICYRKSKL